MADDTKKNPVSTLASNFLLFAIILYAIGWSYLSSYYSTFGLSINEFTFDVREILVLSKYVIVSWTGLLIVISTGVVMLVLYRSRQRLGMFTTAVAGIITAALLLGACMQLAAKLGRADANRDMQETSGRLPGVQIALDKSKLLPYQMSLVDEPGNNILEGFRLLAHGKNGYFIFRPLRKIAGMPTERNLPVLFLPDQSVLGVQTIVGVANE